MDTGQKVIVALLVLAIMFSVLSIAFSVSIDSDVSLDNVSSMGLSAGNNDGSVSLEVVESGGQESG